MLELRNETPFVTAIIPGLDREGRETVTVVVKATFAIRPRSPSLAVADAQIPLVHADVFRGEPGLSSVVHEADNGPARRGTDVVLLGHATAPRAVPTIDVGLAAGRLRKVVRVFGDRVWRKGPFGVAISDPKPFRRMPLVYERAFGGLDLGHDDAASRPCDRRNPVGVGFTSAADPDRIDGVRLPNLEDPQRLIASPGDRPAPAGFGVVGRDWLPRALLAGTYDEAWQRDRCPFLPADFDDRYFQSASAGLAGSTHLQGGEPVVVTHAWEGGELRFEVPRARIDVTAWIRREVVDIPAVLDTLVLEPDELRAVVTWRATALCPRSFLYIERVRVRAEGLS